MKKDLASIRTEYTKHQLDEHHVALNPIEQFSKWFKEAIEVAIPEPTAMTLATVSAEGKPSARIVLLKEFDDAGFVFFTNYTSNKGIDLAQNKNAYLLFFWQELQRQVRIDGMVSKVSENESDTYFASRPRGSQLGAWASAQSSVISGRGELEERFDTIEAQYPDAVPRPPHWGGYRVLPSQIEFWQGRASRLHDRICYKKQGDTWEMFRLSP